jgi:hypothetical protein
VSNSAYFLVTGNGCYVPIRDYLEEAFRVSRMTAAGESGQSNKTLLLRSAFDNPPDKALFQRS